MKPNGKILVVGGAGYIGCHMVAALVERGYDVITLDDLSTGNRSLVLDGDFVKGSMADSALLEEIFRNNPINTVMHFAAYSLVGESVTAPLKYYLNNISATTVLIEAMLRHHVKQFIFSSSAAVYGEPGHIPIREDHPCRPSSPYGTTKRCIEQMLMDCFTAYGLKSISLRYFNAAGAHPSGQIGEMHNPESHLIPLVLKSVLSSQPIMVFGDDYPTSDGTCLRDFIHVSDLVQAHLLALEALNSGCQFDFYNLGNGKGYSVRQVIEAAERVTGTKIETIWTARRSGDPAVLVADSCKIRNKLGWKPCFTSLRTIIASAWKWHLSPNSCACRYSTASN